MAGKPTPPSVIDSATTHTNKHVTERKREKKKRIGEVVTSAVKYSKIAAEYTAAVAPTRP